MVSVYLPAWRRWYDCASNDGQWENQIKLYEPNEGIYVAPRAPTNTWNLWHQAHIDPLFDRLIQGAVVCKDVNPNRVFVMGYSAGGDGVYQLAPRMADRWAAAAMMAGHPNDASPLSLRISVLPFTWAHWTVRTKRNEVAAEWKEKLAALQAADPKGYAPCGGHSRGPGTLDEPRGCRGSGMDGWLSTHTLPEKVVWQQDDVIHDRFYWLALSPDQCKVGTLIEVKRQGQSFFINQVKDLDGVTILLNDNMVDMDKPITIQYQGKTLFEGVVQRTTQALQESVGPARGSGFDVQRQGDCVTQSRNGNGTDCCRANCKMLNELERIRGRIDYRKEMTRTGLLRK